MNNKNRGWQRVLSLIFPYILIVGIFQFSGMLIAGVDINNLYAIKTTEQDMIVSLFTLCGTILVLWIFMKYVDKERFIKLGFGIKNRGKDFIWGWIIGGLAVGLGFIILLGFDEIYFEKIIFDPLQIVFSILLFFIVAIMEEVLMRGYILRNLMISFNKYIALIISSFLFALMHGPNPNIDLIGLLSLFLAGVLLGITYIHTKNLWFPIALHFSWNLFQTHLGFNVSGQESYSLIESGIPESNLLNGGAFGFEGSILAVIIQIVFIIMIELHFHKKAMLNTMGSDLNGSGRFD